MRISRPQLFMEIAHVVAKRSTCFRLNVGAVVTVNSRIVSIGYNGVPSGHEHCKGNDCPGKDGCNLTIHAEVNALAYVPHQLRYMSKDLYVTDSPCQGCCATIHANGVKNVYFAKPYRIIDGLIILREKGVGVYQVMPSGIIIDWETREIVDAL